MTLDALRWGHRGRDLRVTGVLLSFAIAGGCQLGGGEHHGGEDDASTQEAGIDASGVGSSDEGGDARAGVEASFPGEPDTSILQDAGDESLPDTLADGGLPCTIGGATYPAETSNPSNACQACQPKLSIAWWTNVADGTSCGDAGICHEGECGTGCLVGGFYATSDVADPNNPCQTCQPATSTSAWTKVADGEACGNGQVCTAGVCGSYCNITGIQYPSGATNAANACQACQPGISMTVWSNLADGTSCGAGAYCSAGACSAEWVWSGGADVVVAQVGVYGTEGTPSAFNSPGPRSNAVAATDGAGNVWMFGGIGVDSTEEPGYLSDLWKYASGEWTWVSGPNVMAKNGVYGSLSETSASSFPGARASAGFWADAAGNLWMFGGYGYASTGTGSSLNDMWKFASGKWTWMGGSNISSQPGVYGTAGAAAATNIPGARDGAVSWTDASGNLWLFGGYGLDSLGNEGRLNDLWSYASGQWTWMGGANIIEQPGIYGTKGSADTANAPGARNGAAQCTDAAGNLWMFGGVAVDSQGAADFLNDLWEFSSGKWTWVAGPKIIRQPASYGSRGTPGSTNLPGGRYFAQAWIDRDGSVWVFGGQGYDSTGAQGYLNDLWRYSSGAWTWMSGSDVAGQMGTYGTPNVSLGTNSPGARYAGVSWVDTAGALWMLGGYGDDSNGAPGFLDDLWTY